MDGPNLGVGRCRDVFRLDTVVHDGVVVDGVVVDDGGVVVDLRHLRWGQTVMRKIVLVKISDRDKGEMFGAESKIEIKSDPDAIEAPA